MSNLLSDLKANLSAKTPSTEDQPMDLVNGNINLDPFLTLLEDPAPPANVIPLSKVALDTVSFHDFAFYQFLLRTDVGYGQAPNPAQGLSAGALAYLDELEAAGALPEMLNLLAGFLTALENAIRIAAVQAVTMSNPVLPFYLEDTDQAIADLYSNFRWFLSEFFQLYELAGPLRDAVMADFTQRLVRFLSELGDDNFWLGWSYFGTGFLNKWQPLITQDDRRVARYDYPFEVFPSLTVNVGLRLIYRQDWDLLARQKGETVRTVTLGPGQKQRMSVTTSRRKKSTRTLEQTTETETSTETSGSTKDSTEIVNEAVSTFNWKVDAEVHGGIDLIGGSVRGSLGGTSSNQNTSTNSALSETMQKTASKLRRETKVTVSTETEETFETESSFDLVNTNNEMAVTYEFYNIPLQARQVHEMFWT